MADGSIKIDTSIDESGLDKGLASVDKKLQTTTKETKLSAASFAKLGVAVAGVGAAVKIAADTIGDLTDAYKTQRKAETQLEAAAKNNPYLNDTSVQALKNYASEIQSFTTYGDEQLLPFMAQLAASGRTQDEIFQIMAASVDMAASGQFTLDSAVRNLNKSFGGLSGELGESIPEIKSLTAEQLKNGEAVKIMAGRYKGLAKDVAANVGTAEQLSNAFGDLKEELGAPFEKGLGPVRKFFQGIIEGWSGVLKARRELEESTKTLESDPGNLNASLKQNQLLLEKTKKELESIVRLANGERQQFGAVSGSLQDQLNTLRNSVSVYQANIAQIEKQIQLNNQKEKQEADAAAKQAEINQRNKDAADWIAQVTAEREKAIEVIKLQAEAEGKEVDQLDIINAYASSYVKLVGESGGLVTANNAAAVELLSTTRALTTEYERQVSAEEQLEEIVRRQKAQVEELRASVKGALDEIDTTVGMSESEKLQAQLDTLDQLYAAAATNEQLRHELEREYGEKRVALAKQVADAKVAEEIQARDRVLEIANEFAGQYLEIMTGIQSLATKYIEDRATVETAKVEEQYNKGEISAEQYEEKLTEIKKKAAEEQYKVDMWAWGAQLLSAVANTAVGATKALETGPIAGPVLAAMMTAAGAIQIATIMANKPIPPSFATGGIVPGTSYTGDRVSALVNSGEMILNAGQQRNLFDRINSGDFGGGTRVQVFNSAANDVSASPEITEDGVRVMIRKTVSKDMADGRFNKSYRVMQNGLRGTRITN